MFSIKEVIAHLLRRGSLLFALSLLSFSIAPAVFATTYYVGPTGGNDLSASSSSPGSLSYAVANAPSGSTVVLENGVYDGSPSGFAVVNSNVTFQAQTWHEAIVKNSTGSQLWGPSESAKPTGDICQGIVFGPSTGLGWSGGGGASWQFLDCEFVENGGVGAGDDCLFDRCLFTDASSNSFDLAGRGQTIKDCIARRGNRASADDDGVGNKEDFTTNLTVDDFTAYDNNGAAIWFDTSNDGWVVKNSTFFGNHGGNNWYYCGIDHAISTTQFVATGQDGQGFSVGQPIKCLAGTAANVGHESVITALSGYNPQTVTISPALPAPVASGDVIIVQQDSASAGDGFITEANDDGTFINNVAYSNTDFGFYDHASGGSTYGGTGGLAITDNLFAYNGEGFDYWPDGRDDGPALVENNQFKFRPGSSSAFGSGGWPLGSYAGPLKVTFDYNVYDPDTDRGKWAKWLAGSPAAVAGGLTDGSQPKGQDFLQDPATWNQDQHSVVARVAFRGTPPGVYVWPAGNDKNWSDAYLPNNKFSLADSIHQIDDTDGAIENTIDAALAGHAAGDIVTIPVSAHTPIAGAACEVYDLNGRWVALTVRRVDQAAFLAAVPSYVTCAPRNRTVTYPIRVRLTSTDQYGIAATYMQPSGSSPASPALLAARPGDAQALLVWSAVAGADSYDIYRVSASKSEPGSAPVATGITGTSYVDNGASDGAASYYAVTAVNSFGGSAFSNELAAAPHDISGSLVGSEVEATAKSYDLTALGTIDWRQWGDLAGPNCKATGGQISDLSPFGSGKYGRWNPTSLNVKWSDSANGIESDGDNNFAWDTTTNSGWTFTVPADTVTRTLSVLWGGADGTSVSLSAHLSDGSAPDYNASFSAPGEAGSEFRLDTIAYDAAKPGQTLTVTLTKTAPSSDEHSIDIVAVCLH